MTNRNIEEIIKFMSQDDLTDMDKIESLLEGYASVVREYNSLCEQLDYFIKNKMAEELEQTLKGLERPLQEQYDELTQSSVKDFLETAELYGLECPTVVNILKDIEDALQNNQGLRPLIMRYRQIARGNDLRAKIKTIRRILYLNPDDAAEWESNLINIEEELKGQLQEGAKQAIISEDYQKLRQIHDVIMEEPWKNPFNENVIGKIENVLEEERQRERRQLCERLICSAEILTTHPDKVNELSMTVAKINSLLNEGVQLDSEYQQRQLNMSVEAQRIIKMAEDEEKFAKLFSLLETKMSSNAPLEEIDSIYYEMQRLQREIPEITMRRVETYRQNAFVAAKRKRLAMTAVGVVVIAVLLVAGVFVFRLVSRNLSVEEYSARLRTVIDDNGTLSDAGYEILGEIEAKVPDIRYSDAIKTLADELNAKHNVESEKRARFREIQQSLTNQLENYGDNAKSILELVDEIQKQSLPDEEQTKAMEEILLRHSEVRAKYIKAQDATYRKLCNDAGDAYIKLKEALAAQKFDNAKELLPVIEESLKKAEEIPDVTFEARNGVKDLIAMYAKSGEMTEQAIKDSGLQKRLDDLEKSLEAFDSHIIKHEAELARGARTEAMNQNNSLEIDVKEGSASIRDKYIPLRERVNRLDARLEELANIMKEEDELLKKAFYSSESLEELQNALEDFHINHPNFVQSAWVASLIEDLKKCMSVELSGYDGEMHEQSRRIKNMLKVLAENTHAELLKWKEENNLHPIYMVGFKRKPEDVPLDIYFQLKDGESAKNKTMFTKSKFKNELSIPGSYVLGGEKIPSIVIDLSDDGALAFGNQQFFSAKLVYASVNELLSNTFRRGPFGTWLATMNANDYNFTDSTGWLKLEYDMNSTLRNPTNNKNANDAIRTVYYFKNLTDKLVSNMEDELKIPKFVEFNKKLHDLLDVFPRDFNWYSASWEKFDEAYKFYIKLKDYFADTNKYMANGVQSMMDKCKVLDKTLTPIGVLVANNDKGTYSLYRVNRDSSTTGTLFIADHEKKISVKFGGCYIDSESKFRWWREKGVDLPDGLYVACIKK